jgi:hypothetical protein
MDAGQLLGAARHCARNAAPTAPVADRERELGHSSEVWLPIVWQVSDHCSTEQECSHIVNMNTSAAAIEGLVRRRLGDSRFRYADQLDVERHLHH